jgi:succinate dehydrogenase / fumarate reductase, iron-sulfur subunit
MRIHLEIWRQENPADPGRFETFAVDDVSAESSFLELLDQLNIRLEREGRRPVAFDHDCREGICGSCGVMIQGTAHGPRERITACQLHMREFADGDTVRVEPWRAAAMPVLRDLIVDRTALDRIMQAGGYVSVNTGGAPDANSIPVQKEHSDLAFDAATCIGCAACVAQCPNGAAQLFVAAKVGHLAMLPQGQPERYRRVTAMVDQMEAEGFGSCSNHRECEAVCPKGIGVEWIARLNRDYLVAKVGGLGRGR